MFELLWSRRSPRIEFRSIRGTSDTNNAITGLAPVALQGASALNLDPLLTTKF